MLKVCKSKVKLFGIISLSLGLGISYIGLSFYSIPRKAHAAEMEEWRSLTNITYMQEMTAEICNNSKTGESKALIDRRGAGYTNDGIENSYIVKKLSDKKCWMTQNMNLTNKVLSNEDSNTSKTYTIPLSSEPWNGNTDMEDRVYYQYTLNPAEDSNWLGASYTWYIATAGAGVSSITAGEIKNSICPTGWHLPTGNANGEFDVLYRNGIIKEGDFTQKSISGYKFGGNFNDDIGIALFPAAGYILNESHSGVGTNGGYWSSTAFNNGTAYLLAFSGNGVDTRAYPYRYGGYSVRCISNQDVHSIIIPPREKIETDISVQVGPTLTIDAAEGMSGEVDYTKVLEGNIKATISSNLNYDVMLSAAQPALTKSDDSTKTIPPVTAIAPLQKGVSGWGVWTGEGDTTETRTYEPINNSPQPYYNTSAPAADGIGTVHTFGVGIAVSPSIPNGTYSTVVTVTAANA